MLISYELREMGYDSTIYNLIRKNRRNNPIYVIPFEIQFLGLLQVYFSLQNILLNE